MRPNRTTCVDANEFADGFALDAGGGGTMTLEADPNEFAEPGLTADPDRPAVARPPAARRGLRIANYHREEADLMLATQMMQSLRRRDDQSPDRRSRIERLKEAIRSNSYENPLKLSIAVDRMLEGGPRPTAGGTGAGADEGEDGDDGDR